MRSVPDMVTALDLLYRAFYRGVLTRMPERRAVAMGPRISAPIRVDRVLMSRVRASGVAAASSRTPTRGSR